MESWLKPMLCGSADVAPEGDDWQTEPKFDGWRVVTHKTSSGVQTFGGRNGSEYTGQFQWLDSVLADLPDDTAFDGELIHPTLGWNGVQSAMTSGAPITEKGLIYVVFDLLRIGGTDARASSLRDRRSVLEVWLLPGAERIIDAPDVLVLAPILQMDDPLEWAVGRGFEGVVCKHLTSPYQSGMRSPFWLKVKPQTTDEAIVTGFKPGKGSFAGLVGAVEFEMCDNHAQSRASGMTMDVRKHMTEHPEEWLGRIIEIKHHGLSESTGKPRHPQFLRRRDDRAVNATGNGS